MAFDVLNFMDALALYLQAATGLNYSATGSPRAIWRNEAMDEGEQAAPSFSTLRCYGGTIDWTPLPTPSIQIETIGANDAALGQATALFDALTDSDGRPLRRVTILNTGNAMSFRINGILRLGLPGLVGRDAKQRAKVVFNFDAEALQL